MILRGLFLFWMMCVSVNYARAQCVGEWMSHIKALPNGGLGNNSPRVLSDPSGNIYAYAVMVNTDSLNIDGSGISFPMTTTSNNGFFCVKYSPEGVVEWIVPINSVGTCSPTNMQVDEEGNVYLSGNMRSQLIVAGQGQITGPTQGTSYFIIKLNAEGELLWTESSSHGTSSTGAIGWYQDRLYFSIGFSDSLTIGTEVFYASPENLPGNFDHIYGSLDAAGSLLDAWLIGGAGSSDVRAIGCNSIGCLIQGRYDLELTFDNYTLTTPASLHYSLYQLFISHDGELLWNNSSINANNLIVYPFGLSIPNDGHWAISSGFFDGAFSYESIDLSQSQSRDAFIMKTNLETGEVDWLKRTIGNGVDNSEFSSSIGSRTVFGVNFGSPELSYQGETFPNTESNLTSDGVIFSIDDEGKPRCHLSISESGRSIDPDK